MKNRLLMILAMATAVGVVASIPAAAHHGAATLYNDRTVTMKGTVKSWFWSNPHCLLTLDVKGDDGKVVQWSAETQAPSTVYPMGFRKDSFNPGDQVTITVQPAKNDRPFGRLMTAVLADGTKLGAMGGPGAGAEGGKGGDKGGKGGDDSY